ncbi:MULTISPECIES: serine/threonine-protein kinase [unclassified Leifsonia]|uniref:serine/threonine-protein kinase n=1 Tax=unclassified Leifsonia TaxID=2663824 RepID=UPI0006F77C23|nr:MULTISPECIES: serine/threonine-protein kinase [unclassified Leifsonia]KQX06522.1 serine/threonine protein kinase [Leifsonia sp. Root1293]KRA10805.1 serine/threonine protein kinase [Leifsonia sp. Root60]
MTRRLPSTPPTLPGFSYVHVLGSGGFADVFLYEQSMPRRQVAVKVLLSEVVNDQVRQMFQAEANLMAQLSSHPSILTVYQASVSSDGRPYLVMEYCSATLTTRYRADPLPVPEVLAIGVKIASAVETAHRAGVLHRDIKPSNILMTAYGHPVLSDFGIAATLGEAETTEAVGLSIPWSAPEVLHDDVSGTVASEVWSLGATLYSLLAGRSPFEVPGTENSAAELMGRIMKARYEPIGRADIPHRLELTLSRAMSRRPENRQRSVLEFIRELQAVEAELDLPQTPIEVAMDDWAIATAVDMEERTRISGANVITAGTGRRARKQSTSRSMTVTPTSIGRSGSTSGGDAPGRAAAERRSRRLVWAMLAISVVVLGLAVTATVAIVRSTSSDIPTVTDIAGQASGRSVDFSWEDPGLRTGDSYLVTVTGGGSSAQSGTSFSADAATGAEQVCITVSVSREGRTGAPSSEKCVAVEEDDSP